MKKKLFISLLLCALLISGISCLAYAEGEIGYVTDMVGLLSSDEVNDLEQYASSVSRSSGCGVYIVVVQNYRDYINGSIEDFSEAMFNSYSIGLGEDRNCILLSLSMAERDYDLDAHGNIANTAFTDYGKGVLEDAFLGYLGRGSWYQGFGSYIEKCDEMLRLAANGTPVDIVYDEPDTGLGFGGVLIGIAVGCAAGGIVCGGFAAQMKTAKRQSGAANYVIESPKMSVVQDRFTHRTETRQRIETKSGGTRGGGHGGTTVNAGGHSHSSGKF